MSISPPQHSIDGIPYHIVFLLNDVLLLQENLVPSLQTTEFRLQGTGMHEISTHRLTQTTRKTKMTLNSTGSRRLTPNMGIFPQDKVNILGYRILSKKKAKLGTFYLLYQFYWQIYGEINVPMHQNSEKQQQKHVLSPKWRRKGRGILQNIHLTIGQPTWYFCRMQ